MQNCFFFNSRIENQRERLLKHVRYLPEMYPNNIYLKNTSLILISHTWNRNYSNRMLFHWNIFVGWTRPDSLCGNWRRSLQWNWFHRLFRNLHKRSGNEGHYFNWRDWRPSRRTSCWLPNETQFSKFQNLMLYRMG